MICSDINQKVARLLTILNPSQSVLNIMSYRLPSARNTGTSPTSRSASSDDEEDDRISHWASSLGPARQTRSLFDDTLLPTPEEALANDAKIHSFNLREVGDRLGLDLYGRMKLVNWIRETVSLLRRTRLTMVDRCDGVDRSQMHTMSRLYIGRQVYWPATSG